MLLSNRLLLAPALAQILNLTLRRLSTASSGPNPPTGPQALPPEGVFSHLFPECINDYSEATFPFGDKLEEIEELSEKDGHAS